jgi:hypothetical protein
MKKLNQLFLLMATICSLNAIAQTIPSYIPTSGLVGWWPFNGNANDESGSGNNGTVNGSTLTTDRFGNTNKSYSFDGVNDFIEIAYNNSLNNSTGSVSAWIKTNGLLSNNQMLIYGQGQGRPTICVNSSNNHKARLQWHQQLSGIANGWAMVTSLSNIDNSQWVNIVGVYDTIMLKIYINGVLESNYIASYTQWNCSLYNYHIGGFNATSISCGGSLGISQVFNGQIDDIGVWNRALTDCEIKKLYNSGSGLTLSTSSSTICLGESKVLSASGATNYLWSTGATTSSITVTPSVSTVYTVTTTYSVGCTDMRTVNVTVNPCTGINESENSQLLSIFPNPAKTELNINTDINYSSLVIVNSLGQVLLKKEKMDALSIESLSNGVYFIQLLNKENKVIAIKKFIKE